MYNYMLNGLNSGCGVYCAMTIYCVHMDSEIRVVSTQINVTKMQVLRDSRYWIGELNLKRKMEVTSAYRITYFGASIDRVFSLKAN